VIAASTTLRDARHRYFADNGFGPSGGYDDAWVDFKLGPVPFPFPNTAPRVRAVRLHDLHHILTGYATDLCGELEISAWELGAGCAGMLAAWQLNLGGLALGLFLVPRRTFRAFVRGRRCRTLYRETYDEALLARSVAETRRATGLDPAPATTATLTDAALFALAGAGGLVFGTALFLAILPLALVAIGPLHLLRKRAR